MSLSNGSDLQKVCPKCVRSFILVSAVYTQDSVDRPVGPIWVHANHLGVISSRWANGPEIVDPHKNHVNGSHVNNISSKFSEI